jgi:hypothetical protein
MVQMLTRLKPLGRPKQPRPTSKLNNTTIRDFGGGLNVVDSEQNLTSKFSPVFDNMVTYTDKRVGPRFGYEMFLKLKQGVETSGTLVGGGISVTLDSRVVSIIWPNHGFVSGDHVTLSGFVGSFYGITDVMMNRTHGIRGIRDANTFDIVVSGQATATQISSALTWQWMHDTHALGGVPVECKYFSNVVVLWTSAGEILTISRTKVVQRIWSNKIAAGLPGGPIGWSYTDFVASDIFGKELICSNGHDKPLTIDFSRTDLSQWVLYLVDPGNSFSNDKVPAFDACKSAFRYFTVHDTDPSQYPTHVTEIRIAAKDTSMVYSDSPTPTDAVDIDMSKIAASPEQAVRGFATIKDALLVISPSSTTMMKLGNYNANDKHDPIPIDTMNGFGSNAPRSIVEIGSDVFMMDFNGVPSAKLSTISNAVIPERVSNYIETMLSRHIGRVKKETMRLSAFGFYDAKNKTVHFYLPKFDKDDVRQLTTDPLYFDTDMAEHEYTKRSLILRHDAHMVEQGDIVRIAGATAFSSISAASINGDRKVLGVLNENYILIEIGANLPLTTGTDTSGGGVNITIQPLTDCSVGYIFHYVPQLRLTAWSRFKNTSNLIFNCGCGTLEGRAFLFTADGFMMRYGSPEDPVYADWKGMYDFVSWTSGHTYHTGERIFDPIDGLVYRCIADVTTTATDFPAARLAAPDSWEEYKGEPIEFTWELPWSDFGQRQHTKALRFCHMDASGLAQFKLELFADNIYRDAATGQLMPARTLTFVPNEAGAFGAGQQVYGAGRRTREQKLWQVPVKCKLLKTRVSGASTQSLSVTAISLLYQKGSTVRG